MSLSVRQILAIPGELIVGFGCGSSFACAGLSRANAATVGSKRYFMVVILPSTIVAWPIGRASLAVSSRAIGRHEKAAAGLRSAAAFQKGGRGTAPVRQGRRVQSRNCYA